MPNGQDNGKYDEGEARDTVDKVWDILNSIHKAYKEIKPKADPLFFDPYSAMLKMAKDSEIKELFRKMSKRFHPDHGGDEKRMKALNFLYSMIMKSRGKK